MIEPDSIATSRMFSHVISKWCGWKPCAASWPKNYVGKYGNAVALNLYHFPMSWNDFTISVIRFTDIGHSIYRYRTTSWFTDIRKLADFPISINRTHFQLSVKLIPISVNDLIWRFIYIGKSYAQIGNLITDLGKYRMYVLLTPYPLTYLYERTAHMLHHEANTQITRSEYYHWNRQSHWTTLVEMILFGVVILIDVYLSLSTMLSATTAGSFLVFFSCPRNEIYFPVDDT